MMLRATPCSFLRIRLLSRTFASAPSTAELFDAKHAPLKPKSVNEKLKYILPDKNLLDRLDRLRLGNLNKRNQRVTVARRLAPFGPKDSHKSGPVHRPFPFKLHGHVINTIDTWTSDTKIVYEDVPHVALIGRSNVGKSTLLNALVRFDSSFVQKASVTDKPGETKCLTFYGLGKIHAAVKSAPASQTEKRDTTQPALILVDMPGYGFALMTEEQQTRCRELTFGYLLSDQFDPTTTRSLKRVVLLLDARHGLKLADKQFLTELTQAIDTQRESMKHKGDLKHALRKLSWKLQIILTKCDLVERLELSRRITLLTQEYNELIPPRLQSEMPIIPVSGKDLNGVIELQTELAGLVPAPSDELKEILDRKELAKEQQRISRQEQQQQQGGRESTKPGYNTRDKRLSKEQRHPRREYVASRNDDEEWTDEGEDIDNFKPRRIKRQNIAITDKQRTSADEPRNRKERRAEEFAHLRQSNSRETNDQKRTFSKAAYVASSGVSKEFNSFSRDKKPLKVAKEPPHCPRREYASDDEEWTDDEDSSNNYKPSHSKQKNLGSMDSFSSKQSSSASKPAYAATGSFIKKFDGDHDSIDSFMHQKPKNRKEKRAIKQAKLSANGQPVTVKKAFKSDSSTSREPKQQQNAEKKSRWTEKDKSKRATTNASSNSRSSKGSSKKKSQEDEDDDLDEGFEDSDDSQVFRRMAGRVIDHSHQSEGQQAPSIEQKVTARQGRKRTVISRARRSRNM